MANAFGTGAFALFIKQFSEFDEVTPELSQNLITDIIGIIAFLQGVAFF